MIPVFFNYLIMIQNFSYKKHLLSSSYTIHKHYYFNRSVKINGATLLTTKKSFPPINSFIEKRIIMSVYTFPCHSIYSIEIERGQQLHITFLIILLTRYATRTHNACILSILPLINVYAKVLLQPTCILLYISFFSVVSLSIARLRGFYIKRLVQCALTEDTSGENVYDRNILTLLFPSIYIYL